MIDCKYLLDPGLLDKTGILEVLEYWSTGVLEYWSTGILEYWDNEQIYRSCFLNSRLYIVPDYTWSLDEPRIICNVEKQELNISSVFQYSSIPVFQYFNIPIPVLQYSSISIFQYRLTTLVIRYIKTIFLY